MKFLTIKKKIGALVLVTVLLYGCGGILSGFRIGFNASKPLVQSLVVQHVITQEKADIVIVDVGDGVKAAERGESCLKAITVTDKNARRVAKGRCYYQVAQDLRLVLERHNIGGNPRLDEIAAIAASAIQAFEDYFNTVNGVSGDSNVSRESQDIAGKDADKGLESTMKALKKRMERLTKE